MRTRANSINISWGCTFHICWMSGTVVTENNFSLAWPQFRRLLPTSTEQRTGKLLSLSFSLFLPEWGIASLNYLQSQSLVACSEHFCKSKLQQDSCWWSPMILREIWASSALEGLSMHRLTYIGKRNVHILIQLNFFYCLDVFICCRLYCGNQLGS